MMFRKKPSHAYFKTITDKEVSQSALEEVFSFSYQECYLKKSNYKKYGSSICNDEKNVTAASAVTPNFNDFNFNNTIFLNWLSTDEGITLSTDWLQKNIDKTIFVYAGDAQDPTTGKTFAFVMYTLFY